jgi:hypothetical protein
MYCYIICSQGADLQAADGHNICTDFDGEGKIRDNSGPGKAFLAAPTCHFQGKDAPPALRIACSLKISITLEILEEAFQCLDGLGIYEHIPGCPIPFVLLDSHESRIEDYVGSDLKATAHYKKCKGDPVLPSLFAQLREHC